MKLSTVLLCLSLAVTAISIDKVPIKDTMDCVCPNDPTGTDLTCSCRGGAQTVAAPPQTAAGTAPKISYFSTRLAQKPDDIRATISAQVHNAPTAGYCSAQLTDLKDHSNHQLCKGGTRRNLGQKFSIAFQENQGANWKFYVYLDAGYGFTAFVDGIAVHKRTDDIWKGHDDRKIEIDLGHLTTGYHTFELFSGERCCDGDTRGEWVFSRDGAAQAKVNLPNLASASPPLSGHIQLNGQNICIDAAERNKDGGLVHMVTCDSKNENQMWMYTNEQIKNVHGKCLDCHGEGKCHMNTCDPANGNQKFDYDAATSQLKSHSTQKCIDSPTRKSSGKVYVTQCNTANHNQQFTIHQLFTIRGHIKINDNALCVDASESKKDGGKVHMWTCDGNNANQQWVYDSGSQHIKHIHGRCLDCYEHGGVTKCHMNTCNPANGNQKFGYDAATSQVKSLSTQKCLDSPHRHKGGKVHATQCNTANHNQQFTIGGPL